MSEPNRPAVPPAGAALGATVETDWLAAHLFHQGDIDRMLVGLVAPLEHELTAERLIDGWFFLRYWEGGNHVRLRLLVPDGSARDRVRELVTARGEEYFRRNPSPELLHPEQYRRIAADLAGAENLSGYATELYPNDSVVFLPYRREHDRYGYGTAMEAVERHFMDSSRIALDLLTRRLTAQQRDSVCFSLMLLAWFGGEPDLGRLREWRDLLHTSWADRFELLGGAGGVVQDEFAELFARRRERLVGLSRKLRAFSCSEQTDTPLAAWARSIARLCAARYAPALPVLDICVHLLCNRLGISPPGEVYLRYLATRCLDVLAEEGW
ncbi:MAG: thiopeptide-type bacteriocin biosynthesis protein [Pseudonocardiaceae bacterium]